MTEATKRPPDEEGTPRRPRSIRMVLSGGGLAMLGLLGVVLLVGGRSSPHQESSSAATAPWPTVTTAPDTTGVPVSPPAETPIPPGAPAGVAAPGHRPARPPNPSPITVPRTAVTGLAAAWQAAGARNVVGPPARSQAASTASAPVRIEIPSIGVDTGIDPMGLNADGSLQVPTNFARTGYFTGRPKPGDVGPAIVVGHIDDKSGPAAFYRLRTLRPGAEVRIHRADGSVVVFQVERSKQVPKNAFPTDEVYGPTPDPTLRLITCGGSFDRSSGHYRDNTVVFLRLKG